MRRICAAMVTVAMLFVVTAVAARPTPPHELSEASYTFERYVLEYKKTYVRGTAEYAMRKANFKMALARVLEHNADPSKTYWKGMNAFSDWMDEELKAIRGGRYEPLYASKYEKPFVPPHNFTPAAAVDYRRASPAVLTAVKDQGLCGDCWAHAVTEAIESAYAMQTGELFVLSQQQVTSCTPAHYSCYSCNGSFPRLAYDFVASAGSNAEFGLVQEWQYPFESYTGGFPSCRTTLTALFELSNSTVGISGYLQVSPNNESDIIAALNVLGPLSILVDADSWSDYASGVFTGCQFGPGFGLDHAVMLVGYGHDSATGLGYWIVRNSWSAGWGENGYIRIARTSSMQCGVISGGLSCQSNATGNLSSCGPCGLFTDVQFPVVNLSVGETFQRTRTELDYRPVRTPKTIIDAPRKPHWSELTAGYTFVDYQRDFGKTYPRRGSLEYAKRESAFKSNLKKILEHNAKPNQSWRAGVNHLTDRTPEELQTLRGARHVPNFQGSKHAQDYQSRGIKVADQLDYRMAFPPVLTAVKDQNKCGDCWAHAVTESIESSYARSTGQLLVLSQQQITSCTPQESTCYGCNGHYPRYAFEYAANAPYVMEEWVYPFTSFTGKTPACTNQSNPPYPVQNYVSVAGYVQVAPNRQQDVLEALNTLGPLSVLVDANNWFLYDSGVFDGCAKQGLGLDHAVLLVGYGYDASVKMDYWIVRNSWNPSWGELGYIRLRKTPVAVCGMNENGMSCFANSSTVQPTPACGECGVLSDAQFPLVSL